MQNTHGNTLRFKSRLLGNIQILSHHILGLLPIPVCSFLGYVLGRVLGPMHKIPTQQLAATLKYYRPEANTKKLIQQSWGNYGRILSEYSVLPRIWHSKRITTSGTEHLTALNQGNRPGIFLFLHLGNWETFGPKLLSLVNRPCVQIYEKIANPYQLKIAMQIRAPYKEALITNDLGVGRKIYNLLKSGTHLILAVDEHAKGIPIPSRGRPIPKSCNLSLSLRLAKLTNALIYPIFVTRTHGANFALNILAPIENSSDIQNSMHKLDKIFTSIIQQHCDQWYYASAI